MKSSVAAATRLRRFTDEEMEAIRSMRSNGYSYKELMNEFNIPSKGSLHYILKTRYKTKV